eukprot:CAMPEP_0113678188 /NCGR_PEP_ID=MMETSP0038_2-20120614/9772_1 /TAXON_ID=2898 /ORGANISM="Cryptomonas paramecium" /LENGTH=193 /DNA_ID=CAMNT_0000595725 /DNA_START=155 /DNA_END=736 /DNA_ORIENTATION=- /assembly_acc=CAM_ASM_000170
MSPQLNGTLDVPIAKRARIECHDDAAEHLTLSHRVPQPDSTSLAQTQDSCANTKQEGESPVAPAIPVVRKRHGLSYDLDHVDPATRRRMESNRRSAASARIRQQEGARMMEAELARNQAACAWLASENERLREMLSVLLRGGQMFAHGGFSPPTTANSYASQRCMPTSPVMLAPLMPSPHADRSAKLAAGPSF